MSDRRQSGSSDGYGQDGKHMKYSDEKSQETGDRILSSSPNPMGLSSEDLSVFHMYAERNCEGSLEEFITQQQREYFYLQQTLHDVPIPEIGTSFQRETQQDPKGKAKLEDVQINLDSNEKYCPAKELIPEAAHPLQLGYRATNWPVFDHWPPEALFDVVVPRCSRLPIPYDLASDYFQPSEAPQPPNHLRLYSLHLTDNYNFTWKMKIMCFVDEEVYVVVQGWEAFVDRNGVKHNDTIRFFRQNPSSGENCFLVYHELRANKDYPSPGNIPFPQFSLKNLFCEIELTQSDIGMANLEMSGVELPFQCRSQEMVRLTDERGKDWYMIILKTKVAKKYRIIDGWDNFVREHELKVWDKVRLYVPFFPEHGKQILIECLKKKKKENENGARPNVGRSRKGKEKV